MLSQLEGRVKALESSRLGPVYDVTYKGESGKFTDTSTSLSAAYNVCVVAKPPLFIHCDDHMSDPSSAFKPKTES